MTQRMQLERMQWSSTLATFPEPLAGRFGLDADRWRRRALFYERHRDYFPRMASGPFVARCRELEAIFRRLSQHALILGCRIQWVWKGAVMACHVSLQRSKAPLPVAAVRRSAVGRRRVKH